LEHKWHWNIFVRQKNYIKINKTNKKLLILPWHLLSSRCQCRPARLKPSDASYLGTIFHNKRIHHWLLSPRKQSYCITDIYHNWKGYFSYSCCFRIGHKNPSSITITKESLWLTNDGLCGHLYTKWPKLTKTKQNNNEKKQKNRREGEWGEYLYIFC
jgi:hypothetical protein